jgi:hypothetical protein
MPGQIAIDNRTSWWGLQSPHQLLAWMERERSTYQGRGWPIETYPADVTFLNGNRPAAALLARMMRWQCCSTQPEGWFYKTYQEWCRELCLSQRELRSGLRLLKEKGYIQTKLAKARGVPTQHYRVDWDVLAPAFHAFLQKRRVEGPSPEEDVACPDSPQVVPGAAADHYDPGQPALLCLPVPGSHTPSQPVRTPSNQPVRPDLPNRFVQNVPTGSSATLSQPVRTPSNQPVRTPSNQPIYRKTTDRKTTCIQPQAGSSKEEKIPPLSPPAETTDPLAGNAGGGDIDFFTFASSYPPDDFFTRGSLDTYVHEQGGTRCGDRGDQLADSWGVCFRAQGPGKDKADERDAGDRTPGAGMAYRPEHTVGGPGWRERSHE